MKSFIAALRTLVLPFGATSGRRIILDGVNGVIGVYDSAGVLRAQINTASPEFAVYDSSGALLAAVNDTPDASDGILAVEIPTGSPTSLALSVQQQGDTDPRLAITGAGTLRFGDGNTVGLDSVSITRSTSPLRLVVSEGFSVAEDLTWRGEAYTNYTPTWETDGATQPTIGNAIREGWYKQFGRLVHCYGYIQKGSSSVNGTGNFAIGLPTAARTDTLLERFPQGRCWLRDISAPADYPTGMAILDAVDGDRFFVRGLNGTATSAVWSGTVPVTFTTGDWLGFDVMYEALDNIISP